MPLRTVSSLTTHLPLGFDFPDPAILPQSYNGWYYAYATQSRTLRNLQVARSTDLSSWELLPHGALGQNPRYAKNSKEFWAPCAVKVGDQFRLYYTIRPDDAPGFGISVAISNKPESGFIDPLDEPLKVGPGFSVIDPHYLKDPRTGKQWLYWGSHSTPIYAQALREDGLAFAKGSEPVAVLHPVPTCQYRRLLEGFFVMYHEALDCFFGFASGANTWRPQDYGVSVYKADQPSGPFIPVQDDCVLLKPNARWLAPGQGSVVKDGVGEYWFYYHAVDALDARNNFATGDIHRVMCRSHLDFSRGYPHLGDILPVTLESNVVFVSSP